MKKFVSIILTLIVVFGTVFSTTAVANAASISSNKHTATGINGGQTVYIKTNTGWNTELFGNLFRTKVKIKIPSEYKSWYAYNTSTRSESKVNVMTYKKEGNSWVLKENKNYNCDENGYLCNKTGAVTEWVLSGKGAQFKMKISPVINDFSKEEIGIKKVSDMKNITFKITSYGTITKVA